ncbi:MAG: FAD-binding oxidoreductase [Nitrospinota bacterium]
MTKVVVKKLKDCLSPGQLLTADEDRLCYSYDATGKMYLPDVVVKARSTKDISAVLKIAHEESIPVIPRGSGSGFAGGSTPVQGGIALVLSEMNRILEIDRENLMATVEPGVITGTLQKTVQQYGLFYPPDPSSMKVSTIGGNTATCAGGPRAVKYGVTKEYILGVEAVLPDGEIVQTGGKLTKNVAGYDLTALFVGSEGTLGVISKLILKLIPSPETTQTLFALFPTIEDASKAVSAIIASKIIPSTLEFMDQQTLFCVKDTIPGGLPEKTEASLLIEVDGDSEASVERQKEMVEKILQSHNVNSINVAIESGEREALWAVRRSISPALGKLRPTKVNQDIAVPRSRIPEMIQGLQQIASKYQLLIVNFGHAGDGNIHVNIMTDINNVAEYERAEVAVTEIFACTLRLGGTISGEHGIGIAKRNYLQDQVGKAGISLMRHIKSVFDPKNIMNPGKIL